MKRRCPICHQRVDQTAKGNIAGHFDNAKRPCEASGESYDIALRVAGKAS